jgi:hypothetical protein
MTPYGNYKKVMVSNVMMWPVFKQYNLAANSPTEQPRQSIEEQPQQ